ncbi:glycosyl hydrolase family 28-related protein [Paenibacillaceae bacterium WGS1546]|uniref:glycosyl hydrolase family 28-related protein n=1 Tax=Cohnella sp. WGS1546 TaxID=3366810 RepID=UPI00372D6848
MATTSPLPADPNIVNVKSLGAKGNGTADDTQAFLNAIAAAESQARRNPAPSSDTNRLGAVTVYVPAGSYVIRKPEALIRGSYANRTVGLCIQGAGAGLTQILFQPGAAGGPLMKNNDAWLLLTISDMTFDSNSANGTFIESYSTGGAQKYNLERCAFTGTWKYGLYLRGTNNNSEFSFYDCNWSGSCQKMLYVDAGGSDQFVNYNFFACNFEMAEGDFIHLEKGGNVNIWGGSFIHYGNGGVFFRLLGESHFYGTERFLCAGTRVEHRVANSQLIECTWPGGAVTFLNVDATSSMHLRPYGLQTALFKSSNSEMPSIKFDNCRLIGSHTYSYLVNSWSKRHNVVYDNCTFEQHATADTFLRIVSEDKSANKGGAPVVHFRNCRGAGGNGAAWRLWDCDYGYSTAALGTTAKKIVSVKNPDGSLPYNRAPRIEFELPPGAIVTGIRLYWPANAVSSQNKAWGFAVKTGESNPTVLAQASGDNKTPLASGFNVFSELFFPCDTNAKRRLVLESNSRVDLVESRALCLIEYIG